jgi:cell wall-associated NlpC family hydrolase
VRQLSLAAERADARYHAELAVQHRAQLTADRAAGRARAAQAAYAVAAQNLQLLAAEQYETGGAAAYAGQLLLSRDPGDLIDAAAVQQQVGSYQSAIVELAEKARDVSDRANRVQQTALAAVKTATLAAKRLSDTAQKNYGDARAGLIALQAALAKAQASKQEADAVLSLFLGGWALADPAQASALNDQYLALARDMGFASLAPGSDRWTAAIGQSVVYRTLQWIGTPYAWAGGGPSGPSHGQCVGGDAENDCHVIGFDCSGLTMFGWAPYVSMPHYAASQYNVGHFHPDASQLLPGDLLFWSSNGTVGGIHHVAMYVGGGNVIQAPNSGDIVRITPLGNVDSGFFGATRPLT